MSPLFGNTCLTLEKAHQRAFSGVGEAKGARHSSTDATHAVNAAAKRDEGEQA